MANAKNKNLIILILSIVCLVLVVGLIYSQLSVPGTSELTKKDIVENAVAFINKNLIGGDSEAELTGEIEEEGGVYKFELEIGGEKFFSYITKDGKLLFPQGIDMEAVGAEGTAETEGEGQQTVKSCEDFKKEGTPVLEAFVVSYCPFGTQMQRVLNEIVKDIPSFSENIKIRYMGRIENGKVQAMHGEEEAQENLRQICLREEQKDKFYNYLSCFLKADKSQECLKKAGVDEEKLSQCAEDSSRGVAYAGEDFEAQDNYQVTGSPTLILNGERASEFDFGGRTAQAVKEMLCCGFVTEPNSCEKTLSEEQAAAGFSETYSVGESGDGACE